MREFTREDVSSLIDDQIRLDIPEWKYCKRNIKDFVLASYLKHACDDLQEFIFRRMGVSPRISGKWLQEQLLEYADTAKTYEFYARNNSLVFKTQYDVAMDIYDIVYHLD